MRVINWNKPYLWSVLWVRNLLLSLLGAEMASAIKQEVGILAEDFRHTGDGDLIVVHQYPL